LGVVGGPLALLVEPAALVGEPLLLVVLVAALVVEPAVVLGEPAAVLVLAALAGPQGAGGPGGAPPPGSPLALALARAGLGVAAALVVEPADRDRIDPLAPDLDPVALHPLAIGAQDPGVVAVIVAVAPDHERGVQVRVDVAADDVAPRLGRE